MSKKEKKAKQETGKPESENTPKKEEKAAEQDTADSKNPLEDELEATKDRLLRIT